MQNSKVNNMKKISLIISILSISVAASEISIADAYFKQHKGGAAPNENRSFLQDECFIKANEYIYNPQFQKDITINQGDSHAKIEPKKVTIKSPDYESALKALYSCANQSENPIAAWEGLYIINTYTSGVLASKKIDEYKKFSKILYEDKSCDGYLYYGDVFGKGIGTKPNKDKALGIYKEGSEICKEGWHKVVLQMRINNIEKQKK